MRVITGIIVSLAAHKHLLRQCFARYINTYSYSVHWLLQGDYLYCRNNNNNNNIKAEQSDTAVSCLFFTAFLNVFCFLRPWPATDPFGCSVNSFDITIWRTVLIEMMMVAQLVSKLPVFYGTIIFIVIFTGVGHYVIPEHIGSCWVLQLINIQFNIIRSS
jgi:hypothetical protein